MIDTEDLEFLGPELASKVDDWFKWDKNPSTRMELELLIKSKNIPELKSRLLGRLKFGTAGMRAKMEIGLNRFNDLVMIQTAQGVAKYLQTMSSCKKPKIIIGYDARHNSKRFAELCANVFIAEKFETFLFRDFVPTPLVSYSVVKLNCSIGLMVTASHNRKEDNGLKIFWENGAQILAPHDEGICKCIEQNLEPMEHNWDLDDLYNSSSLKDPSFIIDHYFEDCATFSYHNHINSSSDLKIAYSPFHGVGLHFTPLLLEKFGFRKENIFIVEEQKAPDPNFPTVPNPNPEEGEVVLALPLDTAEKNECNLILVNDPDADRLQIAQKQKTGEWRIFTGNEMGIILIWWVWFNWRQKNPTVDPKNVYILNTAVSTNFGQTISKVEGFNYEETLTGFKWMANRTDELKKQGKTVLLSWEESIGFMPGSTIMDKDGVLSAAMFSECAAYLFTEDTSFSQLLLDLFMKYGFHLSKSSYFLYTLKEKMESLFNSLVNNGNYCNSIGENNVKFVRDLITGYDNQQIDNKPTLPLSTTSPMVTYTLESGTSVTLRASGTEPKIKYYIHLITEPSQSKNDIQKNKDELLSLEQDVIKNLIRPDYFGFKKFS